MADWFLGQYLSNRTGDSTGDTTRDKIWAALRYLILVGFLVTIVVFVDQDPVGAFTVALGGALLAAAVVNVLLIPTSERKDALNALWAVAGIALLAIGITQFG
jgi:hypothetical protein